jgi:hypothetical protein
MSREAFNALVNRITTQRIVTTIPYYYFYFIYIFIYYYYLLLFYFIFLLYIYYYYFFIWFNLGCWICIKINTDLLFNFILTWAARLN